MASDEERTGRSQSCQHGITEKSNKNHVDQSLKHASWGAHVASESVLCGPRCSLGVFKCVTFKFFNLLAGV